MRVTFLSVIEDLASRTTVSIEEAYQLLKDEAREKGAKIVTTLFIPTATLEGILKLRSFSSLPIRGITLHGITEGHARTVEVTLKGQPKMVRVRQYLTPDKYEMRALFADGITIDGLEDIYHFACTHNLVVGIQRVLIEHGDKLLDFTAFRPKGIENPISKLATYIGKVRPVRVLDLQKEHDLYTLRNLQSKIPHSELRLCEVRQATGYEASCKFVT